MTKPVFYAYAGELYGGNLDLSLMLPLYEFVDDTTGKRAYSVEESLAGYTRVEPYITLVWPNRMHGVTLPVSDYLPPLIVDAGDDQCPVETSPGSGATVNLYASTFAGHSGSGTAADKVYSWYTWPREDEDAPFATGQEVEWLFSTGVHSVILEVVDSAGNHSFDSLVIEVLSDADSDSVPDAVDNCVNVANPSQCDTNSNGYGNACDGDFDDDGYVTLLDAILFAVAMAQSTVPPADPDTDMDCDGSISLNDLNEYFLPQLAAFFPGPSGLACAGTVPCLAPDEDGDSVPDAVDNCVNVANPSQCDTNSDGYGNACDGDFDNDGDVDGGDASYIREQTPLLFVPPADPNVDMDCNNFVLANDVSLYFNPQLAAGAPGASGFACAGTVPCP